MIKQTFNISLLMVAAVGALGCAPAASGSTGDGGAGGAKSEAGGTSGTGGNAGSSGAGGTAATGQGGNPIAGPGGNTGVGGDHPPIPATVAGHVSVVVRDKGKDTAFDCSGGVGALAPLYASSGPTTILMVTCIAGTVEHARTFRLTVTAMGVPLGVGTHALMSTQTAPPVPMLSVAVVDAGEGFSASTFSGDGGVSFAGALTLGAVGAAKGDTISGSFTASWTHVPLVTGNLTTAVVARAGSVAVSFSFARS